MRALADEISRHEWEWRPETVYLGGGTPSGLALEDLRAILALIPGRPWQEATIEAAPGSVTAERARAWAAAGVNRASLGVQSFVRAELARTGRRHTAEVVAADVSTLREAGIAAINIDLIAGLPGQTAASWRESLDWIARLAPEHVSVYMLELDEDSRLGREILHGGTRYGAGDAPSEELTAELYETAVARLAALGIPRYEISNFAHPGCESRHNLKYWKLEPYVGFGAGAHSFDGRVRRENQEDLADYISGRPAETVDAHPAEERFFVGLRLAEGIRCEPAELARWREPIDRFVREGLLESDNGILRLTDRGVLLSNEVFQEFITT
jgi:oxygen-independent coproporphyrinogen-3 oxidase